jgi:hypothetical protein
MRVPTRAVTFFSDENLVFCPEKTLTAVIAHIHYFPDAWKGQAHTTKVRVSIRAFQVLKKASLT